MKIELLILAIFLSVSVFSQDVEFISEETNNGYIIYANNNEVCPVTVEFDFKLTNLKPNTGATKVFVIPQLAKKFKITELIFVNKNKASSMEFYTMMNLGDHKKTDYDKDYEYFLPFSKGESYNVYQGYNGTFSHQNENAIDFSMPEGTKVLAAREGIVIEVVQKNTRTCPNASCMEFNNYILIYHSDGTFAEYTHLKKNGALVKKGDKIEKGQLIGYSGNTGYSSGPHLHFVVFFQKMDERNTIATKFLTGKGDKTEILIEGNDYKRDY